ncbi:MAG: hypothetical protein L3J49_13565 [Desulfobulbaceae bacterium]|nr:hypothetical protein [Desulfobulbaceae bacterium]
MLTATAEEAAKRTAQGIARAVSAMGTRAVGIAPHDLAAGLPFLKQLERENNLSFLSMNLYPNRGTTPVFKPYLLTRAGTLKIAILGLTGNPGNMLQDKGFHILPWQSILPKILQEVEKQADMIILLSSEPRRVNEEIARQFDTIHILFQSGQGGGNQPPVNINNTLLCQTETRGKSVGFLQINWNSSKTWGKPIPTQLQKEQNRLDRINWQIGRMQKRNTEQALAKNTQFQQLLNNKAQSEQAIQRMQAQIESDGQAQATCSYKNSFIALKASMPEDRSIKAIVDQTRREVNQINRKAQQKRKKQQAGKRQTTGNNKFPEPLQEMAGWPACKKCHHEQTSFYLSTNHAKAWQTLADLDQQYNPDCLLCHVTLPTYDSGQAQEKDLLSNIPLELQGVGCETCHGPARKHSKMPESVLPAKPDQDICLQCHTDQRDKNFIYTEKIQKIRCPAG